MTSTALEALDALDEHPTIATLGGEDAIYAARDELYTDPRIAEVAIALCDEWSTLSRKDTAASFLIQAAEAVSPLRGLELFDVLLTSEQALPDIAPQLEATLQQHAKGEGLMRDVALESWTRLALGEWAEKTNHLRAALEDGASAEDASPVLVRAVGAALSMWPERALLSALEQLSKSENVDSDAAMELGLHCIAVAAGEEDLSTVRSRLDDALRWFTRARNEEDRPDASAFAAVIHGVMARTAGEQLTDEAYDDICETVFSFLDGYIGVDPGWRRGRPHAAAAWADLLGQLHQAESDRWYDPPRTIESLARTMSAHSTMLLVTNASGSAEHPGVLALVQPHVEALLAENNEAARFVKRWLATDEDEGSDLHAAILRLLEELESPPKKAVSGSSPAVETIREQLSLTQKDAEVIGEAVAATPELQRVMDRLALYSTSPSYTEEELLERLLTESDTAADGGVSRFRGELSAVLTHVIRFVAFHLNEGQNSERSAPWFADKKDAEGHWPKEHVLADDINRTLRMQNLNSTVEVANTGGGRVDIAITFPRCHIYIEVKRTDQTRTDEQLVDDYGTQAVQYAATDVPFALLVVADYSRRRTRLDLPAAFHLASRQVDPSSRRHALVTARVQANVASPSATSKSRIG